MVNEVPLVNGGNFPLRKLTEPPVALLTKISNVLLSTEEELVETLNTYSPVAGGELTLKLKLPLFNVIVQ